MVAFGFCDKSLGIIFSFENECSLSGMDNHRWWGYSKLTKNKIELDALSDSGDAKNLRVSLAPPQH